MATKKKEKPTARKPRPAVKPKAKAQPATKSKRLRAEGAIGALDEVLTGIGTERAERIRRRVRAVLNSFR